jgi:hypothetical protein
MTLINRLSIIHKHTHPHPPQADKGLSADAQRMVDKILEENPKLKPNSVYTACKDELEDWEQMKEAGSFSMPKVKNYIETARPKKVGEAMENTRQGVLDLAETLSMDILMEEVVSRCLLFVPWFTFVPWLTLYSFL